MDALNALTEREKEWLMRVVDAAKGTLAAQRSVSGMTFLFFGDEDMEASTIGFKDDEERHVAFRDIRNRATEEKADAFILIGEAYLIPNARAAQLVQFEGISARNVPSEDVIVIQMEVPGVFLTGYAYIGTDRRTLEPIQMRRIPTREIDRYQIEAVLIENL